METNATLTTEMTDDVTGFYCGPYYRGFGGYVVQPGDSLFAIAQRMYGDGQLWPVLLQANRRTIANPHLIFPGQVLNLPA